MDTICVKKRENRAWDEVFTVYGVGIRQFSGRTETRDRGRALLSVEDLWAYFRAASVISCVQAPVGSLVMTGSEPPFMRDATVRV
ncbi:hypothetical protein C8J36_101214 [Rhizobium sp. PP-F2F-G48]|nr:hypothetical protein C8J36_101214 [Rhizobium sp. PP-F2F-G48]